MTFQSEGRLKTSPLGRVLMERSQGVRGGKFPNICGLNEVTGPMKLLVN